MPIDFGKWLEQEEDELMYEVDGGGYPACPDDPPIPGAIDMGSAMPAPCPAEID